MPLARTAALEFLRRAHEQNRLAHAYLITGSPSSGMEVLAAELASMVNGTPAKDVFSAKAREIFVARPESKSRRIVTAQIRALEHALQMRAANGRRKVAIVPDAEECISYGLPAFRVQGKVVAGFAAFKNHLSYLPHSGSVLDELGDELAGYTMTKGSLHFPVDQPLPDRLVERLITVRLRQLRGS